MVNLRRAGVMSAALALSCGLVVAVPASAGSGYFSDADCYAHKYNDSNYGTTERLTDLGTCGILSVRLELQAHSGGHTFWTSWKNLGPNPSFVDLYKPAQTTILRSHHGVKNQNTTSYQNR